MTADTCRSISSTKPALIAWRAHDAPPAIEMSFPPAAACACAYADSMPSVTKWNVVPPFISIDVLFDDQPDVANFEGWTALASWGEITSHAEIGLLVTGVGYRNADLLADMARTVDHISGGRLILGLGAGWYEKDYTTYGYDFGTFGSRFDLFDDSLIRIENRLAALIPPPVRKIPILIGGTGPKRSLPAVARHADIWHAFQDIEAFRKSSDRVDELAATFGRNGSDIERSTLWTNAQAADAFREAGVTLFQTELTADNNYDLTSLKEVVAWRDGA